LDIEEIIKLIFKAASLRRWNDHISPIELVELDKQAHKMVIVYTIAKIQEENEEIDWVKLIEKFLFELFYRLELTDLKPQIFHEMVKERKDDLDKFVLDNIASTLANFNKRFFEKFENYIQTEEECIEDRIIASAHFLATDWEFNLIYPSNSMIYGIDKTKDSIEERIEEHYDLWGVKELLLNKKIYGFVDLCGQLRFQKRWSHIPRVPETSVLGHMLMVAVISYFLTINTLENPSKKRIYNNFFAGLFHDLPEVLTKDIISPIKKSVGGLNDLIGNYEEKMMEQEIEPLIPKWYNEMSFLTKDEFENKIVKNGKIIKNIPYEEMDSYNEDKFSPVDGEIVDFADKLSALREATASVKHGLKSDDLEEAIKNIKDELLLKNKFGVNIDKV